jgi:hypothetical protein
LKHLGGGPGKVLGLEILLKFLETLEERLGSGPRSLPWRALVRTDIHNIQNQVCDGASRLESDGTREKRDGCGEMEGGGRKERHCLHRDENGEIGDDADVSAVV